MLKFNRMFSSLLIATELVVVTYSYCNASMGDSIAPIAREQDRWRPVDLHQSLLSWQTNDDPEPPKPLVPGGSHWRDLLPSEPPKDGENTGTRARGGFCPIAPSGFGRTQVVWNDRPLFIWNAVRGNVTRIEVRDSSNMDNSTLLWGVEPTENKAQYAGEVLEPGQTYYWMVFFNGASAPTLAIPFQIAVDRDRISAELAALELPEDASEEEIARIRAEYFTENELPSDALQEAFSVSEPSKELTDTLEALPEEYCREPEEDL